MVQAVYARKRFPVSEITRGLNDELRCFTLDDFIGTRTTEMRESCSLTRAARIEGEGIRSGSSQCAAANWLSMRLRQRECDGVCRRPTRWQQLSELPSSNMLRRVSPDGGEFGIGLAAKIDGDHFRYFTFTSAILPLKANGALSK